MARKAFFAAFVIDERAYTPEPGLVDRHFAERLADVPTRKLPEAADKRASPPAGRVRCLVRTAAKRPTLAPISKIASTAMLRTATDYHV